MPSSVTEMTGISGWDTTENVPAFGGSIAATTRIRCAAGTAFGQQVAHVLGVPAGLALREERRARRHRQRRDLEHWTHGGVPCRFQGRPGRPDRGRNDGRVVRGGAEETRPCRARVCRVHAACGACDFLVPSPRRTVSRGVLKVVARLLQALGAIARARHRRIASPCHSARCQAETRKLRRIVRAKSAFGSSAIVRFSTAVRCAGTRAGPRRGPCLPAGRRASAAVAPGPIRSSATLVSAMSSSMTGRGRTTRTGAGRGSATCRRCAGDIRSGRCWPP